MVSGSLYMVTKLDLISVEEARNKWQPGSSTLHSTNKNSITLSSAYWHCISKKPTGKDIHLNSISMIPISKGIHMHSISKMPKGKDMHIHSISKMLTGSDMQLHSILTCQ